MFPVPASFACTMFLIVDIFNKIYLWRGCLTRNNLMFFTVLMICPVHQRVRLSCSCFDGCCDFFRTWRSRWFPISLLSGSVFSNASMIDFSEVPTPPVFLGNTKCHRDFCLHCPDLRHYRQNHTSSKTKNRSTCKYCIS